MREFQNAQEIFTTKYLEYCHQIKNEDNKTIAHKLTDFFSDPDMRENKARKYYAEKIRKLEGALLVEEVWRDILEANPHGENYLKDSIRFREKLLMGLLECFELGPVDISEQMKYARFSLLKTKEILYFEAMMDLACRKMEEYEITKETHITPLEMD